MARPTNDLIRPLSDKIVRASPWSDRLNGFTDLQNTTIIKLPSDYLDTNRKPIGVQPSREGCTRMLGQVYEMGWLDTSQPSDVVGLGGWVRLDL